MKTVNMHYAKTNLSKLVEEALAGEDIVIARAGRPRVRLVVVPDEQKPRAPRKPGRWKGKVWMAPDFDETPEELIRAFEGGDDAASKSHD